MSKSIFGVMKKNMLKIAACGPLSGLAARLGTEMKQAIELAIEQKNLAGGNCGA